MGSFYAQTGASGQAVRSVQVRGTAEPYAASGWKAEYEEAYPEAAYPDATVGLDSSIDLGHVRRLANASSWPAKPPVYGPRLIFPFQVHGNGGFCGFTVSPVRAFGARSGDRV